MDPSVPMLPIHAEFVSREQVADRLKRKRVAIEDACLVGQRLLEQLLPVRVRDDLASFVQCVCDLLTFELNAQIEELAKPEPTIEEIQARLAPDPYVTPDRLMKAQAEVETCEKRLSDLNTACDAMPKEMAAIFRAGVLPAAEDALKRAEHEREWIQHTLERQEMRDNG